MGKIENNNEDQALVEKVLGGNTNAFAHIVKNTERLVTRIIFKMISNANDRKDIAQDVYLKTFQNLRSFKFQSKLSTWIGQIAFNTCINYLEKKKLVYFDPNEPGQQPSEKVDIFHNETENQLFGRGLSEILKVEVEQLSPLYKILITLYHNEELSYAEIAEITQLPEGSVKSYLFRARKTLRDNLLLKYKREAL